MTLVIWVNPKWSHRALPGEAGGQSRSSVRGAEVGNTAWEMLRCEGGRSAGASPSCKRAATFSLSRQEGQAWI